MTEEKLRERLIHLALTNVLIEQIIAIWKEEKEKGKENGTNI